MVESRSAILFTIGLAHRPLPGMSTVDRISSAVLRGVSHEGRLIGREACNPEQEGNRGTRVRQVHDVIPYSCGLLDCIGYRMILRVF